QRTERGHPGDRTQLGSIEKCCDPHARLADGWSRSRIRWLLDLEIDQRRTAYVDAVEPRSPGGRLRMRPEPRHHLLRIPGKAAGKMPRMARARVPVGNGVRELECARSCALDGGVKTRAVPLNCRGDTR